MKYGPKPIIEEHYHIQSLIDGQQKRSDDRNYHRDKEKEREERGKLIKDSRMMVATDFWCEGCKKDFKSMAVLQVESDWSCSGQDIAFYKTKCYCGKWCIRFVTDKNKDAYWIKSRTVRAEQGKYANDLIQPYQTGFNLLYGKK